VADPFDHPVRPTTGPPFAAESCKGAITGPPALKDPLCALHGRVRPADGPTLSGGRSDGPIIALKPVAPAGTRRQTTADVDSRLGEIVRRVSGSRWRTYAPAHLPGRWAMARHHLLRQPFHREPHRAGPTCEGPRVRWGASQDRRLSQGRRAGHGRRVTTAAILTSSTQMRLAWRQERPAARFGRGDVR